VLLQALSPGAPPLPGTLLVIAVAVLSGRVERKVRLLVVAVRGCEWLKWCLYYPEIRLLLVSANTACGPSSRPSREYLADAQPVNRVR
jgi:hypothetical protein